MYTVQIRQIFSMHRPYYISQIELEVILKAVINVFLYFFIYFNFIDRLKKKKPYINFYFFLILNLIQN